MPEVTDTEIAELPGWFWHWDVEMFRFLLDATKTELGGGDLAELGVYHGKSAVLIGSSLQPGETFTAVDLFGLAPEDAANALENHEFYEGLDRHCFEDNCTRLLGSTPRVVQGPSASVVDHANHGTHRFVHVDAGHLYDQVVEDVKATRVLMKPGGVVVFDDIRTEHCPGVAAAVWGAVAQGLRPFALTPVKLYATWDHGVDWAGLVQTWAVAQGRQHEMLSVAGIPVTRIAEYHPEPTRPGRWRHFVPPVAYPVVSAVGGPIKRRLTSD